MRYLGLGGDRRASGSGGAWASCHGTITNAVGNLAAAGLNAAGTAAATRLSLEDATIADSVGTAAEAGLKAVGTAAAAGLSPDDEETEPGVCSCGETPGMQIIEMTLEIAHHFPWVA